ncbi:release factor glutamine methyltransferase [Motilibacter rhizosphaerae]|uniref:peptide chain release factor N(5)-glutamine methyltransferase n=1 Tax=Motilibacter rhizosphaerae TaxID=598652 RepID=A0A4Q7NAU5_9ACTN|nr:HemK/PrmC family methyltransferase [Motilibacter rhizosphaerae]RZS80071.1 release factor glutamine methyltransferase [Motilibacter rhizosphaerae]
MTSLAPSDSLPVARTVRIAGVELLVGPGVFTPAPETESVVAAVLELLRDVRRPRVVDLCTGSGTIAYAVAAARPDAEVVAVEASADALVWTRRNGERLGLPVRLEHARALDALPGESGYDLVVSNPPYVADSELDRLTEVEARNPHSAMLAGDDGLAVIREVEQTAWRLLRPGGSLVVEHSDRQGRTAPAVFTPRWLDVADHRDAEGRDRYLTARRP